MAGIPKSSFENFTLRRLNRIEKKVDIVKIAKKYVKLTRRGTSLIGRCPIHEERTPSFTVSPQRQTFHCFGCGREGNVIALVMQAQHLSLRKAVESLERKISQV